MRLKEAREAIRLGITMEDHERAIYAHLESRAHWSVKRCSASKERPKRRHTMTHAQHPNKCLDKWGA
ncbi:MAG: hypothetical protein D6690_18040 [Nitrospirae bacterium]|nr:MAG: hypothetical protein D6690_18040 [Nitrospirota bacterium]